MFHPKKRDKTIEGRVEKVALEEEVWKQLITKVRNKNKELRLHKESRQLYIICMHIYIYICIIILYSRYNIELLSLL